MADAAGRIRTLQVRCPCGESFVDVGTYLEHERLCKNHQKGEDVNTVTPSSSRRIATATARASVACCGGSTMEKHREPRKHGRRCVAHKQQMTVHSNTLDSVEAADLNPVAGSVPGTLEHPIPPAEATAQRLVCSCGKSFPSEKRLGKHLRYSKTHQAGRKRSENASKGRTPVSGPLPLPTSTPPTSTPPPLVVAPGTIPSSLVSVASLISCTCSHAFETQRVLELHRRDSLYHEQQADKPNVRKRQQDNSLVSSFASLKLEPVLNEAGPSVARFACMCGRVFTDQEALDEHKEERARLSWPENKGNRDKMFKTPRPQYQGDEYLRDISAALARQSCGGE